MMGTSIRPPLLLTCALAVATAVAVQGQALPDVERSALAGQVDSLFRPWDRDGSPGAAVLVMRDGEVVHARGYGMAHLEHGVAIGTGTVFDIASVSKQFAALAIALLADEGALSLDDDVRRHIPELPDFGPVITIRHLLHHTSGLRDWPGTLRMAGWDFMDVVSYEQILAMAFQQRELNFVPGSDYAYSNTGYNLLAEVVARVTGQSFRDWTRTRLFEPLGMRDTHFHDDWTEIVPGRAESYRPAGGGGFRRVVSNLTAIGSSSLFTSVDDLSRWVRNFDDPIVGDERLMSRMVQPGVLDSGDPIGYALGLFVDEYRGSRTVSHGGSWAGYRSALLRFPDHRLAVVILGNSSDLNAGALAHQIADLYLADVLEPVPLGTVARAGGDADTERYEPAIAALVEYAGEYRSAELATSYHVGIEEGALVARHFRTGRVALRPVAPDVFQAPVFGRLEFQRDASGGILGFTANSTRIRGLRFERVPAGPEQARHPLRVPPPPEPPAAYGATPVATTLAVSLFAATLLDETIRDNVAADDPDRPVAMSRLGNVLGNGRIALAVTGGAWGVSSLAGYDALADPAGRVVASLVAAGIANGVLKASVGRARPRLEMGSSEFRPFSLDNAWQSFPSGHVVTAFALATAISAEADRPWVSGVSYSAAGLVAWSRSHEDRHWASDIVAGAALGTIAAYHTSGWLRRRAALREGPSGARLLIQPHALGVVMSLP